MIFPIVNLCHNMVNLFIFPQWKSLEGQRKAATGIKLRLTSKHFRWREIKRFTHFIANMVQLSFMWLRAVERNHLISSLNY